MTENNAPVVIGLGELLWDVFPDEKRPGGAPANFAFHAQQLGCRGTVVTRVGADEDGDKLIEYLQEKGLSTDAVQRDPDHKTGWVSVTLDDGGHPDYIIHENVAWDFMEVDDSLATAMESASAVCFGTLAQRNNVSRETIHRAIRITHSNCLRVYDVNLRQNYYDWECVEASLELATIVKLNDDEVRVISKLLTLAEDPKEFAQVVIDSFGVNIVCITRGSQGCLVVDENSATDIPGEKVKVADTVGAGDSFTAGLVVTQLEGWPLEQSAKFANRVGGLVASNHGAMPELRDQLADLKTELNPN